MKLHELEEGKTYMGEDGKEYKVESDTLLKFIVEDDGLSYWHIVKSLNALTQNFTPKKVKRVVEMRGWLNKYPVGRCDCYYATKEEADESASKSRIACVEMIGTYEVTE